MDRRVEITGPVDRKMIINALNCGANVFMADFEDSNSPTWTNNLDGHINIRDAINRIITFTSPEGKSYKLNEKTATLLGMPFGPLVSALPADAQEQIRAHLASKLPGSADGVTVRTASNIASGVK